MISDVLGLENSFSGLLRYNENFDIPSQILFHQWHLNSKFLGQYTVECSCVIIDTKNKLCKMSLPWQLMRNKAHQTWTKFWVLFSATTTDFLNNNHPQIQTFWLLLRHQVFRYQDLIDPEQLRFLECPDAEMKNKVYK